MAKSINLNQTQGLEQGSVSFNFSHALNVIAVYPTVVGTNLTPGERTFTAADGTTLTDGMGAATWTCTVKGGAGAGRVCGVPVVTNKGEYTATPTASGNAATVDSGNKDSTWAVNVGFLESIYTAGADGAVVTAIQCVSNDSSNARVVSLWRRNTSNGPLQFVTSANVPVSSGTNGSAGAVDMLSQALVPGAVINSMGKRVYPLAAGVELFVSVPTIAASCFLNVNLTAETFTAAA